MAGRPAVASWCPEQLRRQRAHWKRMRKYFQESGTVEAGLAAVAAGQAYMQAICRYLESR